MEFVITKKIRNEMQAISIPLGMFFTGVPFKDGKLYPGCPESPSLYYRVGTIIVRYDGADVLQAQASVTVMDYKPVTAKLSVEE